MFEFGCTEEMVARVHMFQLLMTPNNATTGHKLQGKSVDELVIGEFGPSVRNWLYVVLSRVRTIEGLFLLQKIPDDWDALPVREMLDVME